MRMKKDNFKSDAPSHPPKTNLHSQVWDFVSAPDLHPMKVNVKLNKPCTAPGFIFVAPYTTFDATMIGQTGSFIMDQAGTPVWFRPLENRFIQNTDFKVQCYKNKPVLTMWQGTISGTQTATPNLPHGNPEPGAFYLIFDQHYKVIQKIKAQKGYTADIHEFKITKRNTAIFTAVKQVPTDLTKFGGPKDGYINNYSIQEIDIKTGKLLFFWNTLTHVNPAHSMISAASATDMNQIWDCYHMNSVEEGPNNTLLVSMRNMSAIYYIDKKTGKVLWQLGGKKSNFTFGPNACFSWQHDARFLSKNRISLFDNSCCASPTSLPLGQARGLILSLDFKKAMATIDRTYYHNPALIVPTQGNLQKLSNKNRFVGWGQEPYLSEFSCPGNSVNNPSKNLLYDMRYPGQNISYRAFKHKWVGLPLDPPSLAVEKSGKNTLVYVSWNGSTETAAWQVLAGPAPNKLSVILNSTARTGFETKIPIQSVGPYFQVHALDSTGQIIGTSRIVQA
jgi:hypothetical protein